MAERCATPSNWHDAVHWFAVARASEIASALPAVLALLTAEERVQFRDRFERAWTAAAVAAAESKSS